MVLLKSVLPQSFAIHFPEGHCRGTLPRTTRMAQPTVLLRFHSHLRVSKGALFLWLATLLSGLQEFPTYPYHLIPRMLFTYPKGNCTRLDVYYPINIELSPCNVRWEWLKLPEGPNHHRPHRKFEATCPSLPLLTFGPWISSPCCSTLHARASPLPYP
jgi:hypothetical protein